MQNSQDTIKALQQAIAKEDLPQILKLSSALMRQNPQDLQYKQCFTIAAIKSKSYADLSSGIFKEKPHDKGLERIYFYYLYSSGQFQKCIQALNGTKDQGLQLLLAQAYFKTFQYDKSIEIMADLLRIVKLSHQDKELYTVNLLAASTPKTATKVQEFQFLITTNSCKEMLYNFSLFLYSTGNLQKALKFLTLFQDSLQKDDEVDRLTVKLFRDYISLMGREGPSLNKEKKCEQYKNLIKTVKDENLMSVLNNNIIYLSSNHDMMTEHYRNLEELNDPKVKISLMQSVALRINKLSFLNRKNRINESVKVIHDLEGYETILANSEFTINKYFVLKKNKEFENAHKFVNAIMNQNLNLGFCLLVDLCQQLGDTKSIIDSLQMLSKTENEHAKNYVFSLLIRDANLFSQYSNYLDDLIQKSKQIKTLQILLKLYENKQDKQRQILVYNRILEINPKNSAARVGLAQVYLDNNEVGKAEELLKGIEKPNQITDLNYLQYIEKNIHVSKKQEDVHVTEDQKKAGHKKRIKKRKRVRLPKNIQKAVPGFKPDPERWLPKWQRKGYKKKGKKGGNKTQGLSTVGMEQKNVYNTGNSTSAKEVTKQTKRRR